MSAVNLQALILLVLSDRCFVEINSKSKCKTEEGEPKEGEGQTQDN